MDRYGIPVSVPRARQATCLDYHLFAPHRVWAEETRDAIMAEASRNRSLSRPRFSLTPGALLEVIRRHIAKTSDRDQAHPRAGWALPDEGLSHCRAASKRALL